MDKFDQFTDWAIELQSLAQAGLTYGHDKFDLERYQRIREIATEMMTKKTGLPTKKVRSLFCNDSSYPTPKIDTRAAIFKNDKILLVKLIYHQKKTALKKLKKNQDETLK